MFKKIATVAGSLAIMFSLAACNMPTPVNTGDDDCYSVATGREVEDEACEEGEDGYVWGADNGEYEEDDDDGFGHIGSSHRKPTSKPTNRVTSPSSKQTTKSTRTDQNKKPSKKY